MNQSSQFARSVRVVFSYRNGVSHNGHNMPKSIQERLPVDYIERWLEVIHGDVFAVVFKSMCMCCAILFDLKRSDENPAFTSHQIL
ncbi:unnamed protein product [Pocillopora meandrina]|uniref:Uncharacterized protein n=1 Tax=Pocillopora meandrina TaxID=46732 RepID=A0AAU9WDF1_9CNID|nr:unnamed protein product [Pocillopora meandrina]